MHHFLFQFSTFPISIFDVLHFNFRRVAFQMLNSHTWLLEILPRSALHHHDSNCRADFGKKHLKDVKRAIFSDEADIFFTYMFQKAFFAMREVDDEQ